MSEHHFHLVLTAQLKSDLEAVAKAKGLTLSQVIIQSLMKTSSEQPPVVLGHSGWSVSTQHFQLDDIAA